MFNKIEFVCNIGVNSLENIDRILDSNEQDKEKVCEILIANYSNFGLEQIEGYLDIGNLFNKVYQGSLGFNTCSEVIKALNDYQMVLKDSLAECNNSITALFMSAFNCHLEALQYKRIGNQALAISAMAKTGEIAKQINSKYERLSKEFLLFANTIPSIMRRLHSDELLMYNKQRELRQAKKSALDNSLEKSFETGLSFLGNAIKSLGQINTSMLNVYRFVANIYMEMLTNPVLADTDLVEVLESSDYPSVVEEFCQHLEQGEQILEITSSDFSPKKNMAEVVGNMKTGTTTVISDPLQGSVFKLFKATISKGIEQEFEHSYFNWLALAKINQILVNAIEQALVIVSENQKNILQNEKVPLVIALHKIAES